MVREVGVHDDDEGAGRVLQTVDVGCSETELARAGVEFYALGGVGFDELFGDGLGAVGRAVVDYYDFPVEFAVACFRERRCEKVCPELCLLVIEHLLQEPYDDWQVLPFIVCR